MNALNEEALKELENTSIELDGPEFSKRNQKVNKSHLAVKGENLADSRNAMTSSANATVSKRDSEALKRDSRAEFIQKYGPSLGTKAYGAIKELEEYLDPNVYKDEDFQLQQQTRKQLGTVEPVSKPMDQAIA